MYDDYSAERFSHGISLCRHSNLLGGSAQALRDVANWCTVIGSAPSHRLFVAGGSDRNMTTSMFVPAGFRIPELLTEYASVVRARVIATHLKIKMLRCWVCGGRQVPRRKRFMGRLLWVATRMFWVGFSTGVRSEEG